VRAAVVEGIVQRRTSIFAAGDLQIIDSAGRKILDEAVDRRGPLLAAPSPGGAELHDQNVPLEGFERVGFVEDP